MSANWSPRAGQYIIGNHEYALVRGLGLEAAAFRGDSYCRPGAAAMAGITRCKVMASQNLTVNGHSICVQPLAMTLIFLAHLPWYLWGLQGKTHWLACTLALIIATRRAVKRVRSQHALGTARRCRVFSTPKIGNIRAAKICQKISVSSAATPPKIRPWSVQSVFADTSGGRRQRPLSRVLWPTGEVIITGGRRALSA